MRDVAEEAGGQRRIGDQAMTLSAPRRAIGREQRDHLVGAGGEVDRLHFQVHLAWPSILEKSRISLITASRVSPLCRMVSTCSRCSGGQRRAERAGWSCRGRRSWACAIRD